MRGGIAALSDAIPIAPAPDRARFMSEAIRVVYSWPQLGPYTNEPMRRRIAAFFAPGKAAEPHDDVPVPLTASVWSQAVFHRTVSRDDLAAAILGDRSAALVCYALAGMDDETLDFFASHASLLSRIAERSPAQFAAFGESVRVHDGKLMVPGGDAAAAAWESIVGEKPDRPDRFVPSLFEADRGRIAYLFDLLSHLDGATLSLTAGPNAGADSLRRLASLVRRAFPEWEVMTAPFVRPPADLAQFFGRLHSTADIESGGLRTAGFWQKVFDESGSAGDRPADVAWLAEAILAHPSRERERRLDLFSFVERVGGGDGAIAAAHGFDSYPVLMLTLERMGARTLPLYAEAAQQAEKLTALDSARGAVALAQFQGALALIARMASVRTIDAAAAETLARELFAIRLDDTGHYGGGIASWISSRVLPLLPPPAATATIDDVVLRGVAGPAAPATGPRLEWEGQRYRIDPATGELARLRRARDRQQTVTFTTALGIASTAARLAAAGVTAETARAAAMTLEDAATELSAAGHADDAIVRTLHETSRTLGARPADAGEARRVAIQLAPAGDALVGEALLSLAYACDLGDPDGTVLIAGDPSRRHDFGYEAPGRDARLKAMWGVATIETRKGPWHLVGSALALDMAMAPLALRRISVDRVPEAPMLNLMQRDGFAASVAMMRTTALTDADRDAIADRITQGRRRLEQVTAGGQPADAIARDLNLDGWRTRALRWTAAHDPAAVQGLFSLTEVLVLGGGSPAMFNAWGTQAFRTTGCLCLRLAPPGQWRYWWGLSQAGLPAVLVADLTLNVAVVLHNLHLPAVLARTVLAAAMQDFVDATNPTDGNDWLTLARAGQVIDRTRFEDYVASAAADGPLVADADAER